MDMDNFHTIPINNKHNIISNKDFNKINHHNNNNNFKIQNFITTGITINKKILKINSNNRNSLNNNYNHNSNNKILKTNFLCLNNFNNQINHKWGELFLNNPNLFPFYLLKLNNS